MKPIIHKAGKRVVLLFTFGQEVSVPSPFCVGAKMLWRGYSYHVHRDWKYVTCKHCLKKRRGGKRCMKDKKKM